MILLTGATGFVGSSILKKLSARGLRVRCLSRSKPKAVRDGVEWAVGSIQDKGSLTQAMAGAEKVIHLVGIIVPVGRNTFEKVHAVGTHNMVEAAKQAGVKKIAHMSALGTHASAESLYHQTKWKGEVYVRYSGLNYTIFRPSIVFGPDDKFLNMFAGLMRWLPVLPLVGGGVNRLQPIWVEDVAEFFVRALDNPKSDEKTYELGGKADYSMRELLEILAALLGKKRLLIPVPMALMRLQAMLMEMVLSKPPLTRDQLIMMRANNTCDMAPALRDFGIDLAELKPTLERYLFCGCRV